MILKSDNASTKKKNIVNEKYNIRAIFRERMVLSMLQFA